MQAIILAGGFGTRLRSVLADVPKPMAPIHDKPFLAYLMDYLVAQGITEFVLSVHYLREHIQNYFQDFYLGVPVRYSVEEKPLGTGGAITKSLLELTDASLPVFAINGDTFLRMNYQEMFLQHQQSSPLMSMALRKISDCSRYGVALTENNIVTEFCEKGGPHSGLINAGVYLLNPALFEGFLVPEEFSFERDFLFPKVAEIKPEAFVVDEYFIDIGIPEDYSRAIKDFSPTELLSV
jgi:D-glycero-alpha-D-manno-heptose 1-phosphate guanylyltransferase